MRIILDIRDGISEIVALARVARVVENGRISKSAYGNCFTFVTTFSDNTIVYAELTRTGSDKFIVYSDKVTAVPEVKA